MKTESILFGAACLFIAVGLACIVIGIANQALNERTYCNQEYCINATTLDFEACEEKAYSRGVFTRGSFKGYYSSNSKTVERCTEIWKFLEDSKAGQEQ